MKRQSAAELRKLFLGYFERHGHTVVKSSPLIPAGDPTLMFTNAGMVQFKDVFTGVEARPYKRAATSQKCMRVSGKHNDLEEVGRTPRHHTFFEMLGNFSFGDYFKEQAIAYAWELLTEAVGLEPDRLWITVFAGEKGLPGDDEARAIWKKVTGFSDERIVALGMKDNFWAMGDTGPCGPCTEIHYDKGGPGKATARDLETGRITEIWNNVFMQFERKPGGELVPLPKPSVDTGMGLERLATIVQGETSNYHTDVFMPLIRRTEELSKKKYQRTDSEDDVSIRVIADHARTTAFLTADGVQPSNEGRGYVMRRIMRRAIRHGKRLGMGDAFLHEVCAVVVETMGEAYPELREARVLIGKVAELEERTFRRTLDTGLSLLEREMERAGSAKSLPGEAVFKLYDTYGFPKDLTELIARERGFAIDEAGFEREMSAQQERSRGGVAGDTAVAPIYRTVRDRVGPVKFIGYTHEDEPVEKREGQWRLEASNGARYLEARVRVKALVKDGAELPAAREGVVELVIDPSPFYGESGGQVGDRGRIVGEGGLKLEVIDTVKPLDDFTVVRARVLSGEVRAGSDVWAGYVPEIRKMTRAHHSATHLLHASLRNVLGEHVKQAGSLVDPDHLRFDYAHFEAPSPEQLAKIEDDTNAQVTADAPAQTEVLPFEQAKQKGAIALFGEKYGDTVRVLTMGKSIEFCGGTHVKRTSDIGMVLITREEAVASGVRRLEAEVGSAARATLGRTLDKLSRAARLLSGENADASGEPVLLALSKQVRQARELAAELKEGNPPLEARAPSAPAEWTLTEGRRVRDLWQGLVRLSNARGGEAQAMAEALASIDREGLLRSYARLLGWVRDAERRAEKTRASALSSQAGDLADNVKTVGGVQLLTAKVSGVDGKALRDLADQLRSKLPSGILALISEADGGKASLLVSVTKDLTARFSAGDLVKELAPIIGGRGGGKPELAQAGGTDPSRAGELFTALEARLSR
jgi:alanyl-tRNA synthetase